MCCRSDCNSVSTYLLCCLSKSPLKHDFLDIYLTTFFGALNFGNRSDMTVILFGKCSKFNINFKQARKSSENVFCF